VYHMNMNILPRESDLSQNATGAPLKTVLKTSSVVMPQLR